jgi:hypothetical protein
MGHRAGRQPARLEHEQTLATHPSLLEKYKRNYGALAGARGCLENDGVVGGERARQRGQRLIDR